MIAMVREVISQHAFPLHDEKRAQADLAQALEESGIAYEREVVLATGDVVDFMLADGVALEVKLRAPKRAIYRQLTRYARHAPVAGIILASNTAMGLPESINGKPVAIMSLGAGWL